MNSYKKSSIIVLFTITLLTGFIFIIYTQFVQAQIPGTGFDLSGIPGLDLLKGLKGDTGAQGPKGDKGDTGATGAQGPKGDNGDTGASAPIQNLNIKTVKGDIVFNDGAHKSVASCNSDEILTGGGSEHFGGDYRMAYSKPMDNSWQAKSFPLSNDNPSYTQAYAQCQKLVSSS